MKLNFRTILLSIAIAAMLSGCTNYNQNQNENRTESTETEQVQSGSTSSAVSETTAATTAALPQNGELTKKLGEDLSAAFADGSYYFKEIFKMNYANEEDDYIGVSICHADAGREYDFSCSFKIEDMELAKNVQPVDGLLNIESVTYQLDDIDKKAQVVEKIMNWGWVPTGYGKESIPHPEAEFQGASEVEENGVALICESFAMKTYMKTSHTFNYYYKDGKFVKLIHEYIGDSELDFSWTEESTMEYSSEPNESLLTIPKDYEIIK